MYLSCHCYLIIECLLHVNPSTEYFRIPVLQPQKSYTIKALYQARNTKRWFSFDAAFCQTLSPCLYIQTPRQRNWECFDLSDQPFEMVGPDNKSIHIKVIMINQPIKKLSSFVITDRNINKVFIDFT